VRLAEALAKLRRQKDMAKAPLGSGSRFHALARKLTARGAHDPNALAAYIGRNKYGVRKMSKMAAAGRRRKG
jgi:hypothetical protein